MDTFPSEIRGYTPVCLCGRGAYGQVWLVTDAVGCYRALKIVSKSILGDWEREFKGLQNFQNKVKPHPNLIQIFHIEDCGSFFYYTMEVADNLGDEQNYIPSTLENWVKQWGALGVDTLVPLFDQLLDGVEVLHEAGLIHRDIKPDNIVFVENVPKLSDIGLVSSISQTLSLAGTQAYVPPEFLTGEDRELKQSVDIYALGKTLYRAFSGQEPDNFPFVPHKLVANEGGKKLNALVKRACDIRPFCRLKSVAEFRSILHGNIGWWYDIKVFLSTSWQVFLFPFRWLWRFGYFVWRNPWARITAILLFILWVSVSVSTYRRLVVMSGDHHGESKFSVTLFGRAMLQTLVFNIPAMPKYDLYDFYEKSAELTKKYGKKYLVNREEYLKRKYPGLYNNDIVFGVSIGDDEKSIEGQDIVEYPSLNFSPLALDKVRQHVKTLEGINTDIWEVSTGVQWQVENKKRILEFPRTKSSIDLKNELPLFYELNASFIGKGFQGSFDLLITAADYLDFQSQRKQDEPKVRRMIRIPVQSDGTKLTFGKMYFRKQDGFDERPDILGSPLFHSYSLSNEPVRIQIVTVSNCIRVYVNSQLLYFTQVPFFGGFFSVNCNSTGKEKLMLEDFSVYDIRHSDDKTLPDEQRFQLPSGPSPEGRVRRSFERLLAPLKDGKRVIDVPEWIGESNSEYTKISPNRRKFFFHRVVNLLKTGILGGELNFDVQANTGDNMFVIRLREVEQQESGEVTSTKRDWKIILHKGWIKEETTGFPKHVGIEGRYSPGDITNVKIQKRSESIYVVISGSGGTFENELTIDKNKPWVLTLLTNAKRQMEVEFPRKRYR